jgi:hypothetical protein
MRDVVSLGATRASRSNVSWGQSWIRSDDDDDVCANNEIRRSAMTSKLFLRACLAVILSFLGLTVVQAQTVQGSAPAPAATAITAPRNSLATQGGTIQSAKGQSQQQTTAQTTAIGWYYVHATNCQTYFDGVTNWVYLYPQEGSYWYTANLAFGTTWLTACAHNNVVGMYVFSTSGLFNQVFTYSHP